MEIKQKRNKISPTVAQNIISDYLASNISCRSLGFKFGLSQVSISRTLKKNGIKIRPLSEVNRKYSLDEHYFDTIDTEEKAYWLGFLYADGCNFEKRHCVSLGLQEQDKDAIEKFCSCIGFNGPIKFININSKNPKWSNAYRVYFNSQHLSDRLKELGCFERKSLTLDFPTENQVPDYLIRHFVRGYFDGDGSFIVARNYTRILKNVYKKFKISIISTEQFCVKLQKLLVSKIGIDPTIGKRFKDKDTSTRYIEITNTKKTFLFLDWLYKDATIYLNRKYNKYVFEKNDLEMRLRKIGKMK